MYVRADPVPPAQSEISPDPFGWITMSPLAADIILCPLTSTSPENELKSPSEN